MSSTVVLQDYSPDWPEEYLRDSVALRSVLGSKLKAIEHVGSTSVPGLVAKPVIDVAGLVESLSDVTSTEKKALASIGYEYVPKPDQPDRLFFRRGLPGAGTQHFHVFAIGGIEWARMISFRDYLRAHPKERDEYAKLKRQLSRTAPDRRAYTEAKGPFIRQILNQVNP